MYATAVCVTYRVLSHELIHLLFFIQIYKHTETTAKPMFIINPVFPLQKSQLYGPPQTLFWPLCQKLFHRFLRISNPVAVAGSCSSCISTVRVNCCSRDYSRATNLSITKHLTDFQRTSVQLLSKSVSPTHNTDQSRYFLAGQHLPVSLSQAGPPLATSIICSEGLRVAQPSTTTRTCQNQSPQIQLGSEQFGFPMRSHCKRVCAETCSDWGRCWPCYRADTAEQPLSSSVKGLERWRIFMQKECYCELPRNLMYCCKTSYWKQAPGCCV